MSFSKIVGQDRAKRFLRQMIAKKRIPHAYIFTGIPGIGKTMTAAAFAMALNCREHVGEDSCGRCPSCRRIRGGNSPDFEIIEPETKQGVLGEGGHASLKPKRGLANIKIDQIRELNKKLGFPPFGRFRVSVIRHAETMAEAAANSFLKTLEEPPPGNILILQVTEPRDLLPTLVSRCQRVPFQPLPIELVKEWLIREIGLDEEDATTLSSASGGSIGRAVQITESNFMDKRREWLLRLINLPGLSREEACEMAVECAGGNTDPTTSAGTDAGVVDLLTIWESWYRDLIVVKSGGASHLLMNSDFSLELDKIAKSFKMENLGDSLLAIDRAQFELARMRNKKLVMEHTVLNLKRLAV
ncbi:MAG: DNA polymerase III subunit delta' [Desulfatiglans sp.]|jgi:DNA polymerase-3 subunit delta'|nr:DNA polymerase III subunit delta' [Thermodesulfobacteriota bacterium]MEE4352579.1 DNA polymerase III subunit delta' [Desulfatiglans sp.]